MIDEAKIQEAGRRLADAAGNDARVILFGSHARGDAGPGSDLDFLVVEPKLRSRREEFVRLREALGMSESRLISSLSAPITSGNGARCMAA